MSDTGDAFRRHDEAMTATHRGRTPLRRRHRVMIGAAVVGALAIGVGGNGLAVAALTSTIAASRDSSGTSAGSGSTGSAPSTRPDVDGGSGTTFPQFPGDRGSSGGSSTGSSTQSDATASTADEQIGVVTILSTLDYDERSQAAGTGMVISSDGLILTNNHVIESSTSIAVTVESTGETFEAEVVGTDATTDVAVLRLVDSSGADVSGLDTVTFDTAETTAVGDVIHSVGNASGTGELVTATGTVTALDQTIQVGNGSTGAASTIADLVQLDSDVVSGDSGGPLFDDDGEVIGIVTAASSGTSEITGYAIEIDVVLAVVQQIESGVEAPSVQLGNPAFLGVRLSSDGVAGGVAIAGAVDGTPAVALGLAAGDVITAVDGVAVADASALSAAIAAHEPGDSIRLTWTDASGTSRTAAVTLAEGPAA